MRRSWWLATLLLTPAACQYVEANRPPQAGAQTVSNPRSMPEDVAEAPLTSRSLREPYTTYLKVTNPKGETVGYLYRYDPIPGYADPNIERGGTTDSMFVEDREFRRIGFITHNGKAYSFRGALADEIGQAPVIELLPLFFKQEGLSTSPLR